MMVYKVPAVWYRLNGAGAVACNMHVCPLSLSGPAYYLLPDLIGVHRRNTHTQHIYVFLCFFFLVETIHDDDAKLCGRAAATGERFVPWPH